MAGEAGGGAACRMERAVAEGRMTSRGEQGVRRRAGGALGGVALVAHWLLGPLPYWALALFLGAGYGVYETGRRGL